MKIQKKMDSIYCWLQQGVFGVVTILFFFAWVKKMAALRAGYYYP